MYKHWLCCVPYRESLIANLVSYGWQFLQAAVVSITGASSHEQLILSGIKVRPYNLGSRAHQEGFYRELQALWGRFKETVTISRRTLTFKYSPIPCCMGRQQRDWAAQNHVGSVNIPILQEGDIKKTTKKIPPKPHCSDFELKIAIWYFPQKEPPYSLFWAAIPTISYFSSF